MSCRNLVAWEENLRLGDSILPIFDKSAGIHGALFFFLFLGLVLRLLVLGLFVLGSPCRDLPQGLFVLGLLLGIFFLFFFLGLILGLLVGRFLFFFFLGFGFVLGLLVSRGLGIRGLFAVRILLYFADASVMVLEHRVMSLIAGHAVAKPLPELSDMVHPGLITAAAVVDMNLDRSIAAFGVAAVLGLLAEFLFSLRQANP